MATVSPTANRLERAVLAVLPVGVSVRIESVGDGLVVVDAVGGRFTAKWIGEGWLGDAKAALGGNGPIADVLVARRMSPGGRLAAGEAGVGWIDESGGADIALPGLLIARSGRPDPKSKAPPRWTRSVIGVVEALLIGVRPTVAAVQHATGLSAGSATNALAVLGDLGLLKSGAARGRGSAREIADRDRLLETYAAAVTAQPVSASLRVGIGGRDLIYELTSLGQRWDARGISWAATGAAAAQVLGPYLLSAVTGLEVFVDAPTPAILDATAADSGLRPMDGGRLLLRPFPTSVTQRLCQSTLGVRVSPWPRVYADLRSSGVRVEEAAEHLREVIGRG